jgi:sortase family protein
VASSGRRSWRGLAAATLVPGVVAAGIVLLLTAGEGRPEAPTGPSAPALARLADLPPRRLPPHPRSLNPVVPVEGRLSVRVGRFEPLAGGIRPAPPGRIRIPAAGVNAAIEAVHARRAGIEVPPPGWAGWYAGGARPGEPGRAVLIGHLDTSDGPGVFERVPTLKRGSRIEVIDNRGAVHGYRAVGVTRVRKRRFPTQAVYGPSRNPVLVLVTCGGPYIAGRGYRDNVLVYARSA